MCSDFSFKYIIRRLVVFFYLVTTGWIFDISLCENSINQSINKYILFVTQLPGWSDGLYFLFGVFLLNLLLVPGWSDGLYPFWGFPALTCFLFF